MLMANSHIFKYTYTQNQPEMLQPIMGSTFPVSWNLKDLYEEALGLSEGFLQEAKLLYPPSLLPGKKKKKSEYTGTKKINRDK